MNTISLILAELLMTTPSKEKNPDVFADWTVEEILQHMPLSVVKTNGDDKQHYELSLFRNCDGIWFVQYEVFGNEILRQHNNADMKTALFELWQDVYYMERNGLIIFNYF